MSPTENYDMNKICDRLRYELRAKKISNLKAAKDVGVSKDLVYDYTNKNYPERSMQVGTLKKFAKYLDKDDYYFCNDYHQFMDTTDVGKILLEVRGKYNMTQKQFACYLGISLTNYKKYETGRCKLPREVYDKLKNEMGFN